MSYDFFGVQPVLIARLKAKVTGINSVVSGLDQEDMLIIEKAPPAIYVLYENYSLLDQSEREAQITQQWMVVTIIGSDRAADAKTKAGPILGNVLEALLGWQPSGDYGILQLVSAPKMSFQPAVTQPAPAMTESRQGLWHIPLAFQTHLYVDGRIP